MTYPNGRQIGYNYGDSTSATGYIMSRLSSIVNDSGSVPPASYDYPGADQMISEEYNEPGVTLDYSLGGYAMLDQFGRIQGQEWSGASGLLDGYAAYDGAGRCISTLVAASTATDPTPITSTTDNYYAGQQVIQTDSAGSPQYQYVWSPLGSNSLILRDDISGSTGRLYYLEDANGNVTSLVQYSAASSAWVVVEHYTYDAYGNVTVCGAGWTALPSNASAYGNTILFAGCQLDANTGLYLMGARWYDSALGRFISRDPAGSAGSPLNLYTYCNDNPLSATDPSGMSSVSNIGLNAAYPVQVFGDAVFSTEVVASGSQLFADPSFAMSYAWSASIASPLMPMIFNPEEPYTGAGAWAGLFSAQQKAWGPDWPTAPGAYVKVQHKNGKVDVYDSGYELQDGDTIIARGSINDAGHLTVTYTPTAKNPNPPFVREYYYYDFNKNKWVQYTPGKGQLPPNWPGWSLPGPLGDFPNPGPGWLCGLNAQGEFGTSDWWIGTLPVDELEAALISTEWWLAPESGQN